MASDAVTNSSGVALARGIVAAIVIAFVILVLRIIAKIKLRQFREDDVFMIVALSLTIASTVFLCISANNGFGSDDLSTIPFHNASVVLKCIAIQVPLVTISTGIARCSFVLYLLKILGGKKSYQAMLLTAMLLQLCSNITSAVLPLSICRNVRILWDPSVKTTCGNVVSVVKFSYFSSSVNTAVDFFLAMFPTIIFWNLNLKLRIKISLIILLSLGILAMVASIIKTTKLDKVPSVTNLGAGGLELVRWGYAENLIIIITSSVPSIRPLIMSSVNKLSSAARSKSYELSGPFTGNQAGTANSTHPYGTHHNRYNSKHKDEETGSIERILRDEHYYHDRSYSAGGGIKKQVDITLAVSQGSGSSSER